MEGPKVDSVCEVLVSVSKSLAYWMKKQPSVGEESLTDRLLFEVAERVAWITYRKFNHAEEARLFGADWDWWFVGSRLSLGLRIQAKKIKDRVDNYRALAHTNSRGLQIEMLIASAERENLLPFYVFYYAPNRKPQVLCGGNPDAGEDEGTFAADAITILTEFIKPGRARIEAHTLLECSNPLSCFFCCPLVLEDGGGSLIGFREYLRRYFPHTFPPQSPDDSTLPRGFHQQPPAYVSALLELSGEPVPEWFETEYSLQIHGTNGVIVTDLREANER